TIATPLDHPIPPANQNVISVGFLNDDISGTIPSLSRSTPKSTSSLFRQVPISLHHARTLYAQLTSFALKNFATVFIEDLIFKVTTHPSDRERLCTLGRYIGCNLVDCTHMRFIAPI